MTLRTVGLGAGRLSRYKVIGVASCAMLVTAVLAACGSSNGGASGTTASCNSPGVTAHTITVGDIQDSTGPGAASFEDAIQGAQAELDLVNKAGGVDGRKLVLKLADSQSSPTGVVTAAQQLVDNQHVFAVIADSSVIDAAAPFLHQNGVPVIGPPLTNSWGTQPFTNMFGVPDGSINPGVQPVSLWGDYLKSQGATRVATFGLANIPSANTSALEAAQSAKYAGIQVAFVDDSMTFADTNASALGIKLAQEHVDAILPFNAFASDLALLQAARQAGANIKVALFPTGYGSIDLNSALGKQLQGVSFFVPFRPVETNTPATRTFLAALKSAGYQMSWAAAIGYTSMIGMVGALKVAGTACPTRTGLITNFRKVTNFDADGMAAPINFSTIFGEGPYCQFFVKVENQKFVPQGQNAICSKNIPKVSVP